MEALETATGGIHPARAALDAFSRAHPDIWRNVDHLRAQRGKEAPEWSDICFLPFNAARHLLQQAGKPGAKDQPRANDIGSCAMFAAWRLTQSVYRFDPTLYDEIGRTEFDASVPCEVLAKLPEWCPYVETRGEILDRYPIQGFWAFIDHRYEPGRIGLNRETQANFVLDLGLHLPDFIYHFQVPLGIGSLHESLTASIEKKIASVPGASKDEDDRRAEAERTAKIIEHYISLLLYLCSEDADFDVPDRRMAKPAPVRTKMGLRHFPAERLTTWQIGTRIGAVLRTAKAEKAHHDVDEVASGRSSPRPHVRRAHWHGYWRGSKKDEAKRSFALRWMPPIPVKFDENRLEQMPTTIHPVK